MTPLSCPEMLPPHSEKTKSLYFYEKLLKRQLSIDFCFLSKYLTLFTLRYLLKMYNLYLQEFSFGFVLDVYVSRYEIFSHLRLH